MLGLSGIAGLKGVLCFREVRFHALLGCRHVATKTQPLGPLLLAEAIEAGGDRCGAAGDLIELRFDLLQLGRIGWRGRGISGCRARGI